LGRLVQPSQGVETKEVASRRGELGFYKAQQLKQYDRQVAQAGTPLGARTKKVSFSTPEVTSAISPEYFVADSPTDKPLPKVVAKAPTSGLKQKFASLSNLLFSPRQATPLRDPSPANSLEWDHFPGPFQPTVNSSADSSETDDQSDVVWPLFSPTNVSPSRRHQLSPAPDARTPLAARLAFDVTNDDTTGDATPDPVPRDMFQQDV